MILFLCYLYLLEKSAPYVWVMVLTQYGFIIKAMTNVTFWVNVTFFSDKDHII